ncbi:MAG TPA: zinc ribbon domain-containing protein [bacterium (Candidatus Stahlbacteria)]|nr:zinc ribbon domain-containing protein [Candidatus Stahlbacteria bacterium]
MPIFEYHCYKCTYRFECLVMNQREQIICPKCGSSSVEKLFSTFGLSGDKSSKCTTCSATSCQGCK